MNSREQKHWDAVYAGKAADRVSWYRPHLDESLRFLAAAKIPLTAAIIDVGGGASTFIDDVLDRGYSNVTVLDLSATALEAAKQRLVRLLARSRGISFPHGSRGAFAVCRHGSEGR